MWISFLSVRSKHLTTVLFALAFFACIGTANASAPTFNGNNVSATMPAYNVLWYGAKCDNSTDDTTAIQAAVTAASASITGGTARGGQILIPGVCVISSTITVAVGNIYFVGNGAAFGETTPYSSGLKWAGSAGGTMVSFVPSANNTINGGGASNLFMRPSTAAVGFAITSGQGMTFSDISTSAFSESLIEEYKPAAGTPSNMHNHFNHISCVDTSGSGSCIWLKYGEYDFVTDLYGGYHNGWLLRLGGGPTADSTQTEDFSYANGIHGINEASGTGGEVLFDCGSYANEIVRTATGASNVSRGTSTCTGGLSASGSPTQNWIKWWDHCDSNGNYPTVETGAGLSTIDDCGNLYLDGPTTAPGKIHNFNFVEFDNSDLPASSSYECMICMGASNTSNPYLYIGNPTGAGNYTIAGTSSSQACGSAGLDGTAHGKVLFVIDHATSNGLCIDSTGRIATNASTSNVLALTAPYTDFSNGGGGQGANLSLTTTTTAAQDKGAEIALGGQTGNAVTSYAFGGLKCAKQSTAGDGNYGGYCAWYTTTDGGTFTQKMKLDKTGNLSLVTASGVFSQVAHNACGSASGVPCETNGTCSLSAATTCSFTVTVPTGSVCTATPNASDTTTAVEQFKVSLSSSTLTVTELASSSQTATAAANITCL